jgi:hypothetical protein
MVKLEYNLARGRKERQVSPTKPNPPFNALCRDEREAMSL